MMGRMVEQPQKCGDVSAVLRDGIGQTVAAKRCAGVVRRRLWRGDPGNHRVQLYPGSFCHLMVEVTLPTLCLVCHHEDDVAQAIGCSVNRLAPERRVRPPGTVTGSKRNAREVP